MAKRNVSAPWMGPLPATIGCDCQICRPEYRYDDIDRQTIDGVLKHGWQVISVSSNGPCACCETRGDVPGAQDTDTGPEFAYTLGLGHRRGHPELLMSGLDSALMHSALNHVAERVMKGRRLEPGDLLEDVLGHVPVVVERVSDVGLAETVIWSGWFHRRPPEALVLVWPTTSGVFAWQPGAPRSLDEAQPPQWRVPIQHTGAVAADPDWLFPVPPDHRAVSCTHVVDLGAPVLRASRWAGGAREGWTVECGAGLHDAADMRQVHLAHLVRAAPSLRELSGLGINQAAIRSDADSPWVTASLP